MVRKYKRKGARRYPWREWFNLKSFTLVQDVDYDCHTYTMAQQIRNAACQPKFYVRVGVDIAQDGKSLTVWVSERE
jgi:hypothetical protein